MRVGMCYNASADEGAHFAFWMTLPPSWESRPLRDLVAVFLHHYAVQRPSFPVLGSADDLCLLADGAPLPSDAAAVVALQDDQMLLVQCYAAEDKCLDDSSIERRRTDAGTVADADEHISDRSVADLDDVSDGRASPMSPADARAPAAVETPAKAEKPFFGGPGDNAPAAAAAQTKSWIADAAFPQRSTSDVASSGDLGSSNDFGSRGDLNDAFAAFRTNEAPLSAKFDAAGSPFGAFADPVALGDSADDIDLDAPLIPTPRESKDDFLESTDLLDLDLDASPASPELWRRDSSISSPELWRDASLTSPAEATPRMKSVRFSDEGEEDAVADAAEARPAALRFDHPDVATGLSAEAARAQAEAARFQSPATPSTDDKRAAHDAFFRSPSRTPSSDGSKTGSVQSSVQSGGSAQSGGSRSPLDDGEAFRDGSLMVQDDDYPEFPLVRYDASASYPRPATIAVACAAGVESLVTHGGAAASFVRLREARSREWQRTRLVRSDAPQWDECFSVLARGPDDSLVLELCDATQGDGEVSTALGRVLWRHVAPLKEGAFTVRHGAATLRYSMRLGAPIESLAAVEFRLVALRAALRAAFSRRKPVAVARGTRVRRAFGKLRLACAELRFISAARCALRRAAMRITRRLKLGALVRWARAVSGARRLVDTIAHNSRCDALSSTLRHWVQGSNRRMQAKAWRAMCPRANLALEAAHVLVLKADAEQKNDTLALRTSYASLQADHAKLTAAQIQDGAQRASGDARHADVTKSLADVRRSLAESEASTRRLERDVDLRTRERDNLAQLAEDQLERLSKLRLAADSGEALTKVAVRDLRATTMLHAVRSLKRSCCRANIARAWRTWCRPRGAFTRVRTPIKSRPPTPPDYAPPSSPALLARRLSPALTPARRSSASSRSRSPSLEELAAAPLRGSPPTLGAPLTLGAPRAVVPGERAVVPGEWLAASLILALLAWANAHNKHRLQRAWQKLVPRRADAKRIGAALDACDAAARRRDAARVGVRAAWSTWRLGASNAARRGADNRAKANAATALSTAVSSALRSSAFVRLRRAWAKLFEVVFMGLEVEEGQREALGRRRMRGGNFERLAVRSSPDSSLVAAYEAAAAPPLESFDVLAREFYEDVAMPRRSMAQWFAASLGGVFRRRESLRARRFLQTWRRAAGAAQRAAGAAQIAPAIPHGASRLARALGAWARRFRLKSAAAAFARWCFCAAMLQRDADDRDAAARRDAEDSKRDAADRKRDAAEQARDAADRKRDAAERARDAAEQARAAAFVTTRDAARMAAVAATARAYLLAARRARLRRGIDAFSAAVRFYRAEFGRLGTDASAAMAEQSKEQVRRIDALQRRPRALARALGGPLGKARSRKLLGAWYKWLCANAAWKAGAARFDSPGLSTPPRRRIVDSPVRGDGRVESDLRLEAARRWTTASREAQAATPQRNSPQRNSPRGLLRSVDAAELLTSSLQSRARYRGSTIASAFESWKFQLRLARGRELAARDQKIFDLARVVVPRRQARAMRRQFDGWHLASVQLRHAESLQRVAAGRAAQLARLVDARLGARDQQHALLGILRRPQGRSLKNAFRGWLTAAHKVEVAAFRQAHLAAVLGLQVGQGRKSLRRVLNRDRQRARNRSFAKWAVLARAARLADVAFVAQLAPMQAHLDKSALRRGFRTGAGRTGASRRRKLHAAFLKWSMRVFFEAAFDKARSQGKASPRKLLAGSQSGGEMLKRALLHHRVRDVRQRRLRGAWHRWSRILSVGLVRRDGEAYALRKDDGEAYALRKVLLRVRRNRLEHLLWRLCDAKRVSAAWRNWERAVLADRVDDVTRELGDEADYLHLAAVDATKSHLLKSLILRFGRTNLARGWLRFARATTEAAVHAVFQTSLGDYYFDERRRRLKVIRRKFDKAVSKAWAKWRRQVLTLQRLEWASKAVFSTAVRVEARSLRNVWAKWQARCVAATAFARVVHGAVRRSRTGAAAALWTGMRRWAQGTSRKTRALKACACLDRWLRRACRSLPLKRGFANWRNAALEVVKLRRDGMRRAVKIHAKTRQFQKWDSWNKWVKVCGLHRAALRESVAVLNQRPAALKRVRRCVKAWHATFTRRAFATWSTHVALKFQGELLLRRCALACVSRSTFAKASKVRAAWWRWARCSSSWTQKRKQLRKVVSSFVHLRLLRRGLNGLRNGCGVLQTMGAVSERLHSLTNLSRTVQRLERLRLCTAFSRFKFRYSLRLAPAVRGAAALARIAGGLSRRRGAEAAKRSAVRCWNLKARLQGTESRLKGDALLLAGTLATAEGKGAALAHELELAHGLEKSALLKAVACKWAKSAQFAARAAAFARWRNQVQTCQAKMHRAAVLVRAHLGWLLRKKRQAALLRWRRRTWHRSGCRMAACKIARCTKRSSALRLGRAFGKWAKLNDVCHASLIKLQCEEMTAEQERLETLNSKLQRKGRDAADAEAFAAFAARRAKLRSVMGLVWDAKFAKLRVFATLRRAALASKLIEVSSLKSIELRDTLTRHHASHRIAQTLAHRSGTNLRRGWNTWRFGAVSLRASSASKQVAFARVFSAAAKWRLGRGWARWRAFDRAVWARRSTMRRVLCRLAKKTLFNAFTIKWAAFVRHCAARDRILAAQASAVLNCGLRKRRHDLTRAWRQWADATTKWLQSELSRVHAARCALFSAASARRATRSGAAAFARWLSVTKNLRPKDNRFGVQLCLVGIKARLASQSASNAKRRLFALWRGKTASRAWAARRLFSVLGTAFVPRNVSTLARGWRVWCRAAEDKRSEVALVLFKAKAVKAKAAGRIVFRRLEQAVALKRRRLAFSAWQRRAKDAQLLDEYTVHDTNLEKLRARRVVSLARRLEASITRRAFCDWTSRVSASALASSIRGAEISARRRAVAAALARLWAHRVFRGWARWRIKVEELRCHDAARRELHRIKRAADAAILVAHLSRRRLVAAAKLQRNTLRRVHDAMAKWRLFTFAGSTMRADKQKAWADWVGAVRRDATHRKFARESAKRCEEARSVERAGSAARHFAERAGSAARHLTEQRRFAVVSLARRHRGAGAARLALLSAWHAWHDAARYESLRRRHLRDCAIKCDGAAQRAAAVVHAETRRSSAARTLLGVVLGSLTRLAFFKLRAGWTPAVRASSAPACASSTPPRAQRPQPAFHSPSHSRASDGVLVAADLGRPARLALGLKAPPPRLPPPPRSPQKVTRLVGANSGTLAVSGDVAHPRQ
ncbi:hypothetical protein M885DRAFT_505893 [Pelagophyceae sp. CCMP2097]|nr:hypothetical protein M885DRAFT_505893 [Pelagophyceae sp. CCMP2097]